MMAMGGKWHFKGVLILCWLRSGKPDPGLVEHAVQAQFWLVHFWLVHF